MPRRSTNDKKLRVKVFRRYWLHERTNVEPFSVFETADEKGVPEGIHFGPASIHDLRQVLVDLGGTKRVSILRRELIDDKFVEHRLDVLEIGHVAASADDSVVAHCMETLYVFESGERTV